MNPTPNPTPRRTPTPRPSRGVGAPNPTTKPAGWIYVHITADDPRKYVGQTSRAPYTRINEERRTFTWGPDLLPGRDGYKVLRRVESLGDPVLDAIALDLAEAEEIARLHPTENANRPDPRVFRDRLAAAERGVPPTPTRTPRGPVLGLPMGFDGKPVRTPRRTPRGTQPRPWGLWFKAAGLAILAALWAWVALRVTVPMPQPQAPWIAVPVMILLGPAATIVGVRRALFGKRRRRRTRRR